MEEKFKEVTNNSKWTHSIESDNVSIFYNVNNGNYEIEYDEFKILFKDILFELNEIIYNALISLPVKEIPKTDVMSKTISELTKEELMELINKIVASKDEPTKATEEKVEKSKITASSRTLDIVTKFQYVLHQNSGYEDIANRTIELKEYINGLSREELQIIKDDLTNNRVTSVTEGSVILRVLNDAVTSYIGYIDAVKAVNPNLRVDVFGRSIIPTDAEMKSVGDFNIPVDFSGAKTTKDEKPERKVSPFNSVVRKWKEE